MYRILHYNVQGLNNKLCQLEVYLIEAGYDLLCLNEHWLSEDKLNAISIGGYQKVSSFSRYISQHGGVAVFIRRGVVALPLSDLELLCKEIDFEIAGVVVSNVQFLTIYRSPSGDFDTFLVQLNAALSQLSISEGLVVTGDFNVHFEKGTRDARRLSNLFESYGLHGTVSENTRLNSCLDNIFTNLNSSCYKSTVVDPLLSDHFAVSFECLRTGGSSPKEEHAYRPITGDGLAIFYNIVESTDFSFVNDKDVCIENRFLEFTNRLVNAVNESFPLKVKRAAAAKQSTNSLQWFNDEAKVARDTLHMLITLRKKIPRWCLMTS